MKGGTNKDRRPCPDWCTADHQDPGGSWSCDSGHNWIRNRDGQLAAEATVSWDAFEHRPAVTAYLFPRDAKPDVGSGFAHSRYEAEQMARLIDYAADVPKGVLRQLAADVRESAAVAYPQDEAEAS